MRMGRLPALINSAALLGAALAITEAAAASGTLVLCAIPRTRTFISKC